MINLLVILLKKFEHGICLTGPWQIIYIYIYLVEIKYFDARIFILQTKYTRDLLVWAKMIVCSSFATPVAIKPSPNELNQMATDPTEYKKIVNSLQYLIFSCPHAVNKICQYFQEHIEGHFRAVK